MFRPPDDRRQTPTKCPSPSPNLHRLFLCMRRHGYGALRGVHFRDGEPLFEPPFHVVRKVRTAENKWPHRDCVDGDFQLTREHLRLIEELSVTGTGVVDIKVVNGLPVDLEIHEQL